MILDLAGRISIVLVGIVVMSIGSAAIDKLLGVKISGSRSAQIGHVILGMTKGALLMWLMSITGLLGG